MNDHVSASAIVLAVSMGLGVSVAVAQPAGQRSPHERTMIAVTRAVDTGTAAAEALCKPDKALQTRARNAADAAQKELMAAAQAEAEQNPEVGKAHIEAIQAGLLAKNGSQQDADAKMQEYNELKDSKTKDIIDAAFATLPPPGKPPACPPQRQANTALPQPKVPPLPATPQKGVAMLRDFNDAQFKAILAQPELKVRVETLMGLEGCDWNVNPAASRQPVSRQAATFLGKMDDNDLRDTLTDVTVQGRIDSAFGRGGCAVTQQGNTLSFPDTPTRDNRDNGPAYAPGGYPGDNGGRGAPPVGAPGVPGAPFGYGYPYGYRYGYPYGYPYGR